MSVCLISIFLSLALSLSLSSWYCCQGSGLGRSRGVCHVSGRRDSDWQICVDRNQRRAETTRDQKVQIRRKILNKQLTGVARHQNQSQHWATNHTVHERQQKEFTLSIQDAKRKIKDIGGSHWAEHSACFLGLLSTAGTPSGNVERLQKCDTVGSIDMIKFYWVWVCSIFCRRVWKQEEQFIFLLPTPYVIPNTQVMFNKVCYL